MSMRTDDQATQRRSEALEHAVGIEAASASAGRGYDGERVVMMAKMFEAYLKGEDER